MNYKEKYDYSKNPEIYTFKEALIRSLNYTRREGNLEELEEKIDNIIKLLVVLSDLFVLDKDKIKLLNNIREVGFCGISWEEINENKT